MKNLFTFFALILATFSFAQTMQTFTTSGSFIVPEGVSTITVELWGAGGGGGNGSGRREGGGGGGYAFGEVSVTSGETINYIVGTGAVNTTGGSSSFKTISATGGAGGFGQTNTGGAGGVGSGGTINNTGGQGGGVTSGNAGGGGGGGSALNSGNGSPGGISTSTTGGAGGAGEGNGGNGANQSPSGPAQAGLIPGGGGGGRSSSNSNAGAGARGEIRITYNTTLPINLTQFNAFFQNKAVQLNWSKSDAVNFDKFVVEHSTDGSNFVMLEEVAARTSTDYAVSHQNPTKGTNYYRLKLVDRDGSFAYSAVKTVSVKAENGWSIYPTKVNTQLTATLAENDDAVVCILNTNGQILAKVEANGSTLVELPVGNLAAGLYLVQILDKGNLVYTQKFIKE